MKKHILFTPGPQKNGSIYKENIFHRSSLAHEIFKNTSKSFSEFIKCDETMIFPFSATETFCVFADSICEKEVALLKTGYWSDNLKKALIGKGFKVNEYEFFDEFSEKELIELFQNDNSVWFFSVLSETANGKIFDFKDVYKVLKNLGKKLFLDCVSYPKYLNPKVEIMEFCDFTLFNSAKNFMSSPGFSFISYKKNEFENYQFQDERYLNVNFFYKFFKKGELPHTYNVKFLEGFLKKIKKLSRNERKIYSSNFKKISNFSKKMSLRNFVVINNNYKFKSNILMLKVLTEKKEVLDSIFDRLSQKNIYVGADLEGASILRICINIKTTRRDLKKLLRSLKTIDKNFEKSKL